MSPEEAARGVAVGSGFGRASLTELHAGQPRESLTDNTATGCPINLPFCDSATIREAVKRTCIAETTRSDVEFAVATHVEPYGCTFVCSAWVSSRGSRNIRIEEKETATRAGERETNRETRAERHARRDGETEREGGDR